MSTYNGEKFLVEQLESILTQKGVDLHLFVRDDGSTDSTLSIVSELGGSLVDVCIGEGNIGPAGSFLKLLRSCGGAEYYAFADQDDVWYGDKLSAACEMLGSVPGPALYVSSYDVVDENLNQLATFDVRSGDNLSLQCALIRCSIPACAMVFNEEMRKLVAESDPDFVRMHDYWMLLVAEAFHATVFTDPVPRMAYRQHGGNALGSRLSIPFWRRAIRLARSASQGDHERWRQARCLQEKYGKTMPDDSLAIVTKLVNYRRSFPARASLLIDRSFRTGNLSADLLFSVSVLLGVF